MAENDWGIKVSKPNKDVKSCDDFDLIMSSKFKTLKLAKTESPTSGGNKPHTIGYAPAFFAGGSGFVGQDFSSFEATFYSTPTLFYCYGPCTYFLFYQQTI